MDTERILGEPIKRLAAVVTAWIVSKESDSMATAPSFGTLQSDGTPPQAPTSDTPFRIAVLGEFSGRSNRRETLARDDLAAVRPIKVDPEDFDEQLAGLDLSLELPLQTSGDTVELQFRSLDDFHPDQIYDKVDAFSEMYDVDEKKALMRWLMHHCDFRTLESAWRGVDWLRRRAMKGGQVQIVLYDITRQEFAADLMASDDLSSCAIFELLIEKATKGASGEPWAAIVGDYSFDLTHEDADLLGRMARISRAASAPFLSTVDSRVLEKSFDPGADAAAAWDALRQLPESALVGLALPRFLLRLPFGEMKSIDRFEFDEVGPEPDKQYLWGNPGLACASLLAQSFQKQGWAFKPGAVMDLANMPMHVYREDDEHKVTLAEAWLERKAAEKLTALGIMSLLCVKGRDSIQLAQFFSLAKPAKNQPPPALLGRWGQSGVVQLPRSTPSVGVKVGFGMVGAATAQAAPAKTSVAVEAQAESSPEAEPATAADDVPAAAPEPDAAADEMDPELAALLAQMETPSEAPADPAAADESAAPPAEEPAPADEPAATEPAGETAAAEPAPDAAAEEELDPELAALLKQMEES